LRGPGDLDIQIGSLAAPLIFFFVVVVVLTRTHKISMDLTSVVHRVEKVCLDVLLTHLLKDLHAQYLSDD